MDKDLLAKSNVSSAVLDVVNAAILVMTSDGQIIHFNKACQKMTGYAFEEVRGKCPWDLFILPEEIEAVKNVFQRLTAGDFPNRHTNYWLTRSGDRRLIEWANTAITDSNGVIAYVIATGIDVTERDRAEKQIAKHQEKLEVLVDERTDALNKANKQLEQMAHRDGLTGIYNHRYLKQALEHEMCRAVRYTRPLSLILCDVDFFKIYNDTYGHVAGDNCLREIANIISTTFNRAADIVGRYGGEEFAIILPDLSDEEVKMLAEGLRKAVWHKNIPYNSSPIADRVTISVGVATIQSDKLFEIASMIEAADRALYDAKQNGRNKVRHCAIVL